MSDPKSAPTTAVANALADLPELVQSVAAASSAQGRPVQSAELAEWRDRLGWSLEDAMRALVPLASASAHAPISNLRVGAVAACTTVEAPDNIVLYVGANLEFPGGTLSDSVHAEQAAVVKAWVDGAATLVSIATGAVPCGHCRQFLTEVRSRGQDVLLLTPDGQTELSASIPNAFGPEALGAVERVFDQHQTEVRLAGLLEGSELQARALEAARRSHVPYSGCPSGVALRTASGRIVEGRALESVAFNPSLSPLQCALVQLGRGTPSDDPIVAACLGETSGPVRHGPRDARLLSLVAPTVELQTVTLQL